MENKEQKWQSVCVMGACPEFLPTKEGIKLRNSNQPEKVVDFSQEEWRELREAFIEKRI
ncbi:MAG: hypothetical protein WC668_00935 [Patescibacteria group bacterium]|jgi:hypothetical protein